MKNSVDGSQQMGYCYGIWIEIMTLRKKHPNKDIEESISYAESRGCYYQKAGKSAHA